MSLSIYQLKPLFQRLLQPLLARLAAWRVTPNQVTVLALALSLLYGTALALWPDNWRLWAGLPLFMLLRMALNALDGMLAHFTGLKSRLGALLNEMGDQISDAALVLPFALIPGVQGAWVVLVALGALLAEFAGILAVMVESPRRFDGPMGKSDRAFVFGGLALMVSFGVDPVWANGLLYGVAALLVWTVFNRLRAALHQPCTPPTP